VLNWNNKFDKKDRRDKDNIQNILTYTFVDTYASSLKFYLRLNRSFLEALSVPFTVEWEELREIKETKEEAKKSSFTSYYDYLRYQNEYYKKYEKIIMSRIRNKFDKNFREEEFTRSLSDFIDSNSDLAKLIGFGQVYQYASNFTTS
jgi:polyhydroxyalkanoate synthase